MSEERKGAPTFQPCPEREELLKKAASARREYDELRHKLKTLIGAEDYHAINERARAALHEAELAVNKYRNHVQEHGCNLFGAWE
jgi:predicted metal-binding transcription factor (methanogenesis marker protein 9)